MNSSDSVVLPKRLLELLGALTDRDLAMRLRKVWEAAAACIDRLATMNLVPLEPKTVDEAKVDSASWQTMAGLLRQTVRDISALSQVMVKAFSAPRSTTAEFSLEASDHHIRANTGRIFKAVSEKWVTELATAKKMLEAPPLSASRWAVLAQLQKLRSALRRSVGDAVYLSAATCGAVRREDVVPGFMHEVKRAALFRATVADLRRSIDSKLAERHVSVVALISDVVTDLDLFTRMPAWRHVRAEAKRRYLQLKEQLTSAASRQSFTPATLGAAVAPMMDQLVQMSLRHSGEILAEHDRGVVADTGLRIEQTLLQLELNTGAAASAFSAALSSVEALYGRAQGLDDFIRHTRGKSVTGLVKTDLHGWVLELKTRLDTLPAPGERENFER